MDTVSAYCQQVINKKQVLLNNFLNIDLNFFLYLKKKDFCILKDALISHGFR